MLYVTGDTHGEYSRLSDLDKVMKAGDTVIVCGDWGYVFDDTYKERMLLDDIGARPWTMLFADGNHENFTELYKYPTEIWNGGVVHRIRDNIMHLCRGQVFVIEGKKIFTFGGGYSIDKMCRREGVSWWKEEMPSKREYDEADYNLNMHERKVDYIITHTAPEDTMCKFHPDHYDEKPLNNFLEYIRETVEYKKWFFGHLHLNKDLWRNQIALFNDLRILD